MSPFKLAAAGAVVLALVAGSATAQSIRAQSADPVLQRLTAIEARLARVEAQVVVIHQTSESGPLWLASSDNWGNNNDRATALCQEALAERFGRVLSRQRTTVGDRYYLSRVVCETNTN
jgi:hypothetical protein